MAQAKPEVPKPHSRSWVVDWHAPTAVRRHTMLTRSSVHADLRIRHSPTQTTRPVKDTGNHSVGSRSTAIPEVQSLEPAHSQASTLTKMSSPKHQAAGEASTPASSDSFEALSRNVSPSARVAPQTSKSTEMRVARPSTPSGQPPYTTRDGLVGEVPPP